MRLRQCNNAYLETTPKGYVVTERSLYDANLGYSKKFRSLRQALKHFDKIQKQRG